MPAHRKLTISYQSHMQLSQNCLAIGFMEERYQNNWMQSRLEISSVKTLVG